MPKLLHVKPLYAQLKHYPKLSSQRLSQYVNGLINLGSDTPRKILKQVMVVGNYLTSFAKARKLVITNVTVKLEGTVVDRHS